MKNIIILNGSPRAGGNSDAMTAFAYERLRGKSNAEVYTVRELKIADCVGCYACMDDERGEVCVIDDDAKPLVEKLYKADAAIVLMPLYFTTVPGIVKMLFDRFFVHYNFPKGLKVPDPRRKACAAWTYGGSPEDVIQRASEYAAYCFRDLRYGIFDDVRMPQCKDKTAFQESKEYQSRVAALCDWLLEEGTDSLSGRDYGISRNRFAEGAAPPETL